MFLIFGCYIFGLFAVRTLSGVCLAAELDKSRYIGIDEIKAGMKGYCLSCFKGTEVEKFDLEVISIVRNMNPGRDAIIVKSSDERFIHAGLIGGVSGSPVYIEGRLAGAMSFGWSDSKDPVYGVTPIVDMINAGKDGDLQNTEVENTSIFDFSKPLNLLETSKIIQGIVEQKKGSESAIRQLPCTIVTSGLPESAVIELQSLFDSRGFVTVAASAGGSLTTQDSSAQSQEGKVSKLSAGSPLIIPMVIGDIIIAVTGTVTEVDGDKVYGFGHGFLGYGPVDLPMATGEVHTIIAGNVRSFKLATPLEIVGKVTVDEARAIIGKIGAKAYMFPMSVKIDRYNDTQPRQLRCQVAYNRLYTPMLAGLVIVGAAGYLGDFPPDNTIEYKVFIKTKQTEPIVFGNTATGSGVGSVVNETLSSIALFMNNPFERIEVESIDIEISIKPRNISAHIWSVEASDTKLKAGQKTRLDVVLETVLEPKKRYSFELTIPENLKPGNYEVIVCGTEQYVSLLNQLAPQRFVVQNSQTLIDALKMVLSFERDNLYCILLLPPSGIVLEKSELADLPATRALVLSDPKRTLVVQPLKNWQEQKIKTGTIVVDRKNLQINVVEK
jgi:hypothetical protein